MHSRKSRTFRSYIRNARARVGKVAGTRDISNRYRSRCLFDSSFILFLFFLSFSSSLSLSLSPQPRIINASSRVWHAREAWKLYRFPPFREDNERNVPSRSRFGACIYIYIYIRVSKSMDKSGKRNLSGDHATSTDILSRNARSRELEGLMWFRGGREVARRMDRMFRKPPRIIGYVTSRVNVK